MDMAIAGRGFFQVLLPDGTVSYTRDGSFHLNSDGQIVTSQRLRPGASDRGAQQGQTFHRQPGPAPISVTTTETAPSRR